ncbi:LsmAD domain-containing protein [Mucor mucedo]|uniref:LsmAD domain-containing protein n=1 Tax=Mucor mucedo TaxID=29922 RepID=UPI002220D41F|nr:LsmAD domain-containing protein [Mucor mucedo]KAI7887638.1 LsmAD domain-containing protein [Mucor mucedo]
MHDRMLYLLGNLTGSLVEATVKDGSKFKGILHGASTEGDLGIALKLAQKIFDPSAPIDKDKTNPNPIKNTLMIFSKDLVEINAMDVDLLRAEPATADRHTFKTDTDISGKSDIKERELHKWAPAEDENALGLLEGDLESSAGGSWDQFAANEKLFGLKTDFDEEIYTTTLNRSAPGYKDREKRAIKMANEIQKTSTTNVHMMEERGMVTEDNGMDEEDLYGAVVRNTSPNKYVPPALRKQVPQQQVKKEVKSSNNSPLNKLITSDLPKASGSNPSPIANLPTTRRESGEKSSEKANPGPPKRIEAEIANTFKQFAIMEKDKLHAKKQALQKKEKDGRLAELKMFHQTFKLNVPIPADLVPLLSKGKKAPDSASKPAVVDDKKKKPVVAKPAVSSPAAAAASPAITPAAVVTPPVPAATPPPAATLTSTATATSPAPSNTASAAASASAAAAAAATAASFKFNAKASSFKPNPTAAAFVPGGNSDKTNFVGRQLRKGDPSEHLTMTEAFVPSFVEKDISPSSVGPTWPFGNKSYRVQFNQFAPYEEDVFTGYPSPQYGYGYPQYRYPQYVQGMPPMAVQQGPYMNPQFVQNVPIPAPPNGGPPVNYSPQMGNVSPHGSPFPQGFPSPQRSPMVPQGMPHQVYQYQGGPMMMRYPPEMMQNNGGGPPVMMQRPVMVENMQYSPHHQHDTSANDSGTETPPAN